MLSSDTVLGVKNEEFFTKGSKISYAILTQNYDHLPCGTPMMVAMRKGKKTMAGLSIFPARANNGCGQIWTPASVLKTIDKKPLNETHQVRTIQKFDYSQFGNIIELVKEYGGISFVSKGKTAAMSMLNSIQSIVREYKYSSLFQFSLYHEKFLSGKDDDLLNVMSFFDFEHCIPLFNLRKIDGIGISFSQVLRKHTELLKKQVRTLQLHIVASNYKDNLFTIDGTIVDHIHPIPNSLYKETIKYIAEDLPVKKDKLKIKSKTKKQLIKSHELYDEVQKEVSIKNHGLFDEVSEIPSGFDEVSEVPPGGNIQITSPPITMGGQVHEEVEVAEDMVEPSGEVSVIHGPGTYYYKSNPSLSTNTTNSS